MFCNISARILQDPKEGLRYHLGDKSVSWPSVISILANLKIESFEARRWP